MGIFKTTGSKILIFALKLIHFESFILLASHICFANKKEIHIKGKYILFKKLIFFLLFAFQTIHLIHISLKIVYLCPDYCSLAPSQMKFGEKQGVNHNFIIDMTWMILSVHQSQSVI